MIKIFVMINKQPHMTDEQFHAHWRHPHGTLTCRVPQIRAYVQDHGISSNAERGPSNIFRLEATAGDGFRS